MERFLRYSLERNRPIRAVFMLNGEMTQKQVSVVALDPGRVSLRVGAKKKPVILSLADILSCAYARGDHGEGV